GDMVVGGTAWCFADESLDEQFDYLFVDEAGQVGLANLLAMATSAKNIVLVGDPQQLPQVILGSHPGDAGESSLEHLLEKAATVATGKGVFLPVSRRMHTDVCTVISDLAYDGRLTSDAGANSQRLTVDGVTVSGASMVKLPHSGNAQSCPQEVKAIKTRAHALIGAEYTDRDGKKKEITWADILIVAPYNAQVNALREAIPKARVGTVDKFQGQEAPICLISMTTSSAEEMPRDMGFLFSINRLNVAISRAKILAEVYASPALLEVPCRTLEDMKMVSAFCALQSQSNE
ncbi:MAG: DEAD/DEAH box helicase, partial [Rhodobacterales bacterium]|nr:DEAD/DEAH box helicase [Rhodobacterales bacterium]